MKPGRRLSSRQLWLWGGALWLVLVALLIWWLWPTQADLPPPLYRLP